MSARLQFRHVMRRAFPPWLLRPWAERFLYSIDLTLEGLLEWSVQGAQARMPGQGTPTALPYIGRDRRIRRGFTESDDSYAARLLRWIDDHRIEGGPLSVINQLRGLLSGHEVPMRYVHRPDADLTGWMSVDAAGAVDYEVVEPANWDWDGLTPSAAHRWWLVLYPPSSLWVEHPTFEDETLWGGTLEGDGFTIGCTATPEQVAIVEQIVNEWKSAGSQCLSIIVCFDSDDFEPSDASPPNPDGTWRYGSKNDGGTQVPARLASAAYWGEPV